MKAAVEPVGQFPQGQEPQLDGVEFDPQRDAFESSAQRTAAASLSSVIANPGTTALDRSWKSPTAG
ncbi:hypothetical protein [Saccharopolyspora tripterygii]